jgi:hypothetical protein
MADERKPKDEVKQPEELSEEELDKVAGGTTSQEFEMLQQTVNTVVKSIGDGLTKMAQKG